MRRKPRVCDPSGTCQWPGCGKVSLLKLYDKRLYCPAHHNTSTLVGEPTIYDINSAEWKKLNLRHRIECDDEEYFFQASFAKIAAIGTGPHTEKDRHRAERKLQLEMHYLDAPKAELKKIVDRIMKQEINAGLI